MVETLIAVQTVKGENGEVYNYSYYRLEEKNSYGVCIKDQKGAMAMIPNVTTKRCSVNTLLRKMIRCGVSPASMRDVVEDWLLL